jgi:hypothetical protein
VAVGKELAQFLRDLGALLLLWQLNTPTSMLIMVDIVGVQVKNIGILNCHSNNNNICEQALKRCIKHRKNSLFYAIVF